jgi:hypothetical protein
VAIIATKASYVEALEIEWRHVIAIAHEVFESKFNRDHRAHLSYTLFTSQG